MTGSFDEEFGRYAENLRRHLDEIAPTLRGLPFDEAEQRLTDELQTRGVWATDSTIRAVARMASDPTWPFRHPLQHRRWVKEENARIEAHNAAMGADEDWLEGDPVSVAVSEVMDEVDAACTYSVRPPGTHSGAFHLVTIRPYTEARAARIRRSVERLGIEVVVREHTTDDDLPPWTRGY